MVAYRTHVSVAHLALYTVVFTGGSTLVHSAACVINDICDVEFDRKVGEGCYEYYRRVLYAHPITERTKNRPLAARRVSTRGAWILLGVLVVGCGYLLSCTNKIAYVLYMRTGIS